MMLGLGEREEEVIEALHDLYENGCTIVTIGQYLAPTLGHIPVTEYITPEKFDDYRKKGLEIGFKFVESSPLVRSSFHAEKHVGQEQGARSKEQGAGSMEQGARSKEQGAGSREQGLQNRGKASNLIPHAPSPKPHAKVIYDDLDFRDYKETWEYQEQFFNAKVKEKGGVGSGENRTPDRLIFVEHNHVYTLGKSGSEQNLLLDYIQLQARNASFYHIDRGGDITYHGPGQLVGYPIFDLEAMKVGLREYIHLLEDAVIRCILRFGITGGRLEGATGVWIDPGSARARKICAIGVRASRYVTMHGFALNVSTDLSYFNHINPCGFTDKGVTSIEKETGRSVSMTDVKEIMKNTMREVFGYEYY